MCARSQVIQSVSVCVERGEKCALIKSSAVNNCSLRCRVASAPRQESASKYILIMIYYQQLFAFAFSPPSSSLWRSSITSGGVFRFIWIIRSGPSRSNNNWWASNLMKEFNRTRKSINKHPVNKMSAIEWLPKNTHKAGCSANLERKVISSFASGCPTRTNPSPSLTWIENTYCDDVFAGEKPTAAAHGWRWSSETGSSPPAIATKWIVWKVICHSLSDTISLWVYHLRAYVGLKLWHCNPHSYYHRTIRPP